MLATIAIKPETQCQFHQLGKESQRLEAEIIREALAGCLADDRRYVEVLRQRIESTDRGEFASDEEADAFFIRWAA